MILLGASTWKSYTYIEEQKTQQQQNQVWGFAESELKAF